MNTATTPAPAARISVTCWGTDCYVAVHRGDDGRMHDATGPHTCGRPTTTQEVTMIYTDALAADAYDAACEDACEDPRQYDTLADEYAATGAIRPPAAVVEPVRWVVLGRRMATNRAVRMVVVGGSRDAAIAAARAKWGAVMIDQAAPALGR